MNPVLLAIFMVVNGLLHIAILAVEGKDWICNKITNTGKETD
jgi:hypothetical protein